MCGNDSGVCGIARCGARCSETGKLAREGRCACLIGAFIESRRDSKWDGLWCAGAPNKPPRLRSLVAWAIDERRVSRAISSDER